MEQTVETVNLYQIITLFIIELVCNDNVKHINNFKTSGNFECKKCRKSYQYKSAYDTKIEN